MNKEYLIAKREEVLKEIKPICEAFGITDYDYKIGDDKRCEELHIEGTIIGCDLNSVYATVNELIGYIFIKRWCKSRCLGAFETQTKNVIKRYWKN
jgi:hypothetical protein